MGVAPSCQNALPVVDDSNTVLSCFKKTVAAAEEKDRSKEGLHAQRMRAIRIRKEELLTAVNFRATRSELDAVETKLSDEIERNAQLGKEVGNLKTAMREMCETMKLFEKKTVFSGAVKRLDGLESSLKDVKKMCLA